MEQPGGRVNLQSLRSSPGCRPRGVDGTPPATEDSRVARSDDAEPTEQHPAAPRPERRRPYRFFATCARGTEGPLRTEMAQMGLHGPTGDQGGVWFRGALDDGARLCLHSRFAMRVLLVLSEFEVTSAEALYDAAHSFAWDDWIDLSCTFAVTAKIRDSALNHSGYAALKVKDAIADALRDRLGARPNVDPKDPDVAVHLHVRGSEGRLLLDLAGAPLHRRGYRVAMTEAPLKETLAAAALTLGRVAFDVPMIDPMAGSGTLAIEHALAARHIAPGLGRTFGFERWPGFRGARADAFAELKKAARAAILPRAPAPIVCADRCADALAAARANASQAGVGGDIEFRLANAGDLDRAFARATVCTNPPYGERLDSGDLPGLYASLAHAFARLEGYRVVLVCGNPELSRAMGARPEISHRLFNGDLEVRLLCYEIEGRRVISPRHGGSRSS